MAAAGDTAPELTIESLSTVLGQLESVVRNISPDQEHAPTPCASWDVAQVMDHVLFDLGSFTDGTSGREIDWSAAAEHVPADQWVPLVHDGRESLLHAWRDHGEGDLAQQVAEICVHTWDLAQGTGQRPEFDGAPAAGGLAWMRGMLKPEYRGTEADGKMFGPEVAAPAGSDPYVQIAAFAGRRVV